MIMISACQTVGQKRKENINSGKRKKERAQTQKKKGHMPYMWGVVWGQRKESGERANKSHGGGELLHKPLSLSFSQQLIPQISHFHLFHFSQSYLFSYF
jgi:hypothetical protein